VKPTDVMVDAGVLYRRNPDGSNLIGVGPSRGGLQFNPNRENRNVEFDGKTSMIAGLDRTTATNPQITGTLIDLSAANFGMYEPGMTSAQSGSVLRIKPLQATEFLAEGAYIYDLLWIGRGQQNNIKVVGFPCALVTQYDISAEDKNEAGAQVTIEARIPEGAMNINEVPYRIFEAPDLSALDALFPAFWDIAGYVGAP
jgi:hypothetical protein